MAWRRETLEDTPALGSPMVVPFACEGTPLRSLIDRRLPYHHASIAARRAQPLRPCYGMGIPALS
jgi:hypothetical protein